MRSVFVLDNLFIYLLGLFAFLTPISKKLSGAILIVTFIIWMFLISRNKINFDSLLHQPLVVPIACLYGMLLLTVPFSVNVTESFLEFLRILPYTFPLLALAALNCCQKGFGFCSRTILQCYIMGCVVTALYAIYQYINTQSLYVKAFSPHHAILGSFFEIAMPILAALFLQAIHLKERIVYFIASMLCFIALILTQARGPWIGAFIAVFIVMVVMRKLIVVNKKTMFVCVIIILLVTAIASPLYFDRVQTIADPTWASNYHRVLIWQSTIELIKDYPLTGVGLLQFINVYNEQYLSPLSIERSHPHAHNSYLMYAAESGLINSMFFLYLIYKTLQILWRQFRYYPTAEHAAIFALFIAILANSMVDNFFWSGHIAKLMWLFIGLSVYGTWERN